MSERATGEQLRAIGLGKEFTLHNQGGLRLPVLGEIDLTAASGECVVLHGPSGAGKSTLLRTLYGNYGVTEGHILVRHGGRVIDLAAASPRLVIEVRQRTIGFVSQFLRVIPRVPTLELVAEPLRRFGVDPISAGERAAALLQRLAIPRRLWDLPPATFSGGEQQRVNIARGMGADYLILLLDEPTAALDAGNRDAVVGLIAAARRRGAAIIGVFHDRAVRDALGTRTVAMAPLGAAA